MLARRACRSFLAQSRGYSSTATRPVPTLSDGSVEAFRKNAFLPALPTILPQSSQAHLPAATKWFTVPSDSSSEIQLNTPYLSHFANVEFPVELTSNGQFVRIQQSLGFFLKFVYHINVLLAHQHAPPLKLIILTLFSVPRLSILPRHRPTSRKLP